MDTIKVNVKKNGNKYRSKKRKFQGNRYTKLKKATEENNSISISSNIDIENQNADSNSNIVNATTPYQTQDNKDAANLKLPSPVEAVKILRKRKKVTYYSQETSSSSSEDIEEPQRTDQTANKVAHIKEVAQSILMCILDKKQGVVPKQCSTSQQPSAQILRANKRQPKDNTDASIKTGSLTTFHHNVHELMVLLTNTDSGNVEDIEAVIANVLEEHKQLEAWPLF